MLVILSAGATFAVLSVTLADATYSIDPELVAVESKHQPPEELNLNWPSYGQAAIATQTHGVVATHGNQVPHPTASTAKLITVMAILEKQPLEVGQSGPTLTMTARDVQSYSSYIARNGTNTPVYVGLELTQYQALQSIMLASSNNMSDTLAEWAFGSIEAYHQHANEMVQRLGANDTVIAGDASGLSPATTSTAQDMALLSLAALKNPVIAEIVAQASAEIPFAGTIYNSNWLLDGSEIVGLKTGETVEAGGNFLLAANHQRGDELELVVVVVYGAPLASIAMPDSLAVYRSAKQYLSFETVIKQGEVLARYQLPNGQTKQAIASQSVGAWRWAGQPALKIEVTAQSVTQDSETCSNVGLVGYGQQTAPLLLADNDQTAC